ncbi:MAG: BppU family phage baseplate upper protein, partial [Patescibacteria group bacterium]
AAIQNGLATAENQATIISNQETINTNIGGIPAAVWAVSTRTLTSFGTLVASVAAAVWDYLTSAITTTGSIGKLLKDNIDGKVSERGMILPVMQAQVYSATASQSADVKIVQGDTPTIPFDLGDDYSGWTPYFGAKESLDDTDYAITPKAGSWSDAIEGEGSVTLTTAETATPGKYLAEIELRNGDSRLTAIKFNLIIVRAVITESET